MSITSFDTTLERLKRRALALAAASGAAWGWCGALGLLVVGIWLDLVWELSAVSRASAWGGASMIALGLVVGFVCRAVRNSSRVELARRLDTTAQTGGQIVSGYALQSYPNNDSPLSQGLARLAVIRASEIAASVSPIQAVPSKPARRAGTVAIVSLLAFVLAAILAPRLAHTEWLRFADPFGDHPPYSPTQFLVEPGEARVRYGDGLDVVVKVEGPSVDDLELVVETFEESGQRQEKLPMFFDSVGHWRASIASITVPGRYFVQSRSTRSSRYKIEVMTVPQIENVRFRVIPPDYTRDAVYEGPMPQGGLSGLAGTQVELSVTSNRPLGGGEVAITAEQFHEDFRLEPATAEEACREVRGAFTIQAAGSFSISVTDVQGQRSRDAFHGTVQLMEDHRPLVRIVEPPAQSLATPSVSLPVIVSAEDDYGVTRLQLFRSLNDSRPLPVTLELPLPAPRRHEQLVSLPLLDYGLQPGDVIKLFARVEDNDPAGPKGSESSLVVIQIISDEELEQLVRAREGVEMLVSKYQAAERRLESLQEEIDTLKKQFEKRDADGELSESEQEQLETLAKRIEEEAKAIEESASHVLPYDLDQSLNEELQSLVKRMQDAAKDLSQSLDSQSKAGQASRKLAEVREKLSREKQEMKEQINEPLERLAEIYPLMEDQSRFLELYYRQRDLAERLASLKNHENPDDPAAKSRMRELESEQRRIREDLEELLNDIELHAGRLPDDDPQLKELAESSLEFVEAVRGSGAATAMSDAESGLGEFSGVRGHRESKNAADILEKFLSKCQGNSDQGYSASQSLKFRPGPGSLGETINQLLQDAGFKPGNSGKSGSLGSGGGYSARRNSLQNMGMYGKLPTRGNPQSSRSGGGKNAPTIGGSYRTDSDQGTSSRLDPHGLLRSSGVSEATMPSRYRGRIQDYFQRIADEAGSASQRGKGQ